VCWPVLSWPLPGLQAGRTPQRRPILYSLIPGGRGACREHGFRSRPVADAIGAPVLRDQGPDRLAGHGKADQRLAQTASLSSISARHRELIQQGRGPACSRTLLSMDNRSGRLCPTCAVRRWHDRGFGSESQAGSAPWPCRRKRCRRSGQRLEVAERVPNSTHCLTSSKVEA
jgi:hypothetical protein